MLARPVLAVAAALFALDPWLAAGVGSSYGRSGDSDELRAVAVPVGTTLVRSHTLREELKQVESQLLIDGQGKPPKPVTAPTTKVRTDELVVTEEHRVADSAAARRFVRTFERASGTLRIERESQGAVATSEQDRVAEVTGRAFEVRRADDGAWSWRASDDGPALALDPARLQAEATFAAWLPEEGGAVDWDVPAEALAELLTPGGDLGWHVQDDPHHRPGDQASATQFGGTIRARRVGDGTPNAAGLVSVALEFDVEATRDLVEETSRRARREAEAAGGEAAPLLQCGEVLRYRGAGSMEWDARLGRLSTLSVALEVDSTWRRTFTLEMPSGRKEYAETIRSRGRLEAAVTCAQR